MREPKKRRDIRKTKEICRPAWRDVKAFYYALWYRETTDVVAELLANRVYKDMGLKEEITDRVRSTEIAKRCLPDLLEDIKITDISDYRYWLTLLLLCFIFLLVEAGLIIGAKVTEAAYLILGSIAVISSSLFYYIIRILYHVTTGVGHPNPRWFHTVPALVAGLGTLFVNFILVISSGGSNSPFLPALLTITVVVIGLPRENSRPAIVGSIIAMIVGPVVIISEGSVPVVWSSPNLYLGINIITFLYSSVSILGLRKFEARGSYD